MAKELSVLQQQAEAIKTEVNKGANTSSRIGGMFGDMLEYNEEKLTELETYKTPVSHGNKYIKEIYLSGDFDKTHTYVLSRIARNNTTYKWAIYIKDLDTSIEYYLGFNSFTEEPKFIDSMKLYKTSGSGSYYITAIINWEIIDEGISLQNLELPLSNIFSLEKNPFINSNINMSEIKDDIDAIEAEINGELDESVEKSSELDLEKTFSIEFAPVLPTMSNKYIIEIIDGSERIKPRTFGCSINRVLYIELYDNITYESDTKAIISVAESEWPIKTFQVQVGVINQLQKGNLTVRVTNVSDNIGIKGDIEKITKRVEESETNIQSLNSRVEELESKQPGDNFPYSPTIHICDLIDCVVGDTIQLYYNMFVHHIGDYSLNIECPKGKNYPRYWEYTPTSNDVGNTSMKIQLLNIDGSVIQEKTISIVTKNATNPSSDKNILLVGDSLYMSGQIAIELSRRLKGTVGVATLPTALELSNFNIVGRLKNSDGTVGWEGTGGWSWASYTTNLGMEGVRLTVSGVTDVRATIDTLYKIDGYTQQFYISEINVVEGTGYIFAAFFGKGDIYNDHDLMPESGVLKKQNGEGQEEINFSASQVESYQPFWNTETDSFDIKGYVDTYCDGHIEILCVQLGINSIISSNPFTTDFESVLSSAKKFIDLVHEQLPNTKIYLATLPLPSQNGGIGANYAAGNANGSYLTASWNYKVHQVNDLYRSLLDDENYKTFVSVIDVCSEMDSENNYPASDVAVNTRSATTEKRGTNGIHPFNDGYWQIADAWFRSII